MSVPPAMPRRLRSARARAATILAATALGACGGSTTLGSISVDEELGPTRVPGSVVNGVLPAALPPLALDVTTTEAYASGDHDHVTKISIPELRLTVAPNSEDADEDRLENGVPDDLSFLSGIDLYIVATMDDGTERTERLGGVPENDPRLDPDAAARTVALDMTGVDILDFVEASGGYAVRIDVKGLAPPDDVVFDGDVRYRVGVGFR